MITITPTRHYNSLIDKGEYYIKSSIDIEKIAAEIKFYEQMSEKVKTFYPEYLGRSNEGKWPTGYKLKKINNNDLSIYFVGLRDGKEEVFQDFYLYIKNYLSAVPKIEVEESTYLDSLKSQIFDRNIRRINSLKACSEFDTINTIFLKNGYSSIDDYREQLHQKILAKVKQHTTNCLWQSHGDLCLSNIIINNSKLYLIDPRGISQNTNESYLIPYYDMAKLSQCLLGGYDFINHELEVTSTIDLSISFKALLDELNMDFDLCRLIESSHFLAMLPLHINKIENVKLFAFNTIKVFKAVD